MVRVVPEPFFWILHMQYLVVWFPAVMVAKQRVGNLNRKDFLEGLAREICLRLGSLFDIRISGVRCRRFPLFFQQAPTGGGGNGGDTPAIVWRGFSGHWMVFYFAALVILYSATKANSSETRCLNGHLVPPGTNFCTQCGQAAIGSLGRR